MPKVDDLVRQSTVRRLAGATEIERTFRVTGLITAPENVLFAGIEFPGIPVIGDAYPSRSEYRVRDIRGRIDNVPNSVLVVVTYSNRTGNTWNQADPIPGSDGQDVKQVTTSIASRKTIRDRLDQKMLIPPPAGAKWVNYESYQSEAEDSFAVANIVFERTETEPPNLRARNFVSKVNSAPINVLNPTPFTYVERSLRFSFYDSRSVDGGRTWRATYEFQFNSRLWNHIDYWRQPDGRIPTEAEPVSFEVEDEADFNTLGLDWDDEQVPLP